jgi:hypothetical protein
VRGGPQTHKILKYVLGSFGLNSVPLTEGSILDRFLRSGSDFSSNYRRALIIQSRGGDGGGGEGRATR